MPSVSRETASESMTTDSIEVRLEHLEGGYSVCFESHTADADLRDLFRGLYLLCTVGVCVTLLAVGLLGRRARIVIAVGVALVAATGVALALRSLVDTEELRSGAGMVEVGTPTYPTVMLAATAAVAMSVTGYLTRPTRRLIVAALVLAVMSALLMAAALPVDAVGALTVAWGVAAITRFAVGSPAGTPTPGEVVEALDQLGVDVVEVQLTPEHAWGEVNLRAVDERGAGPG